MNRAVVTGVLLSPAVSFTGTVVWLPAVTIDLICPSRIVDLRDRDRIPA